MQAWRILIGRPLRSSEAAKEEINPVEGLSALSLDALTSVAYGPQALLVALAPAGLVAFAIAPWITAAIVGLLVLLVLSYMQVIDAYPGGGGAYAVARANLGTGVSLLAGAALIVDYTLTVAVAVAAGVASLSSAFPALIPLTVPICLAIIAVITLLNLRGLGEGARAFLLPTVVFIAGVLVTIGLGLFHPLDPGLTPAGAPEVATKGLEAVGILLVLKAFSAGCSALTGVEAIANGTPLFRQRLAKQTELLLGVLLGVMLIGLAILVQRLHIVPRANDTVLSQIMAKVLTPGWAYDALSIVITVVLALAANTSFGSLPVLASLLAKDNYLPHALALRGDRLVFTNGIWILAILSASVLAATGGNTDSLIPLFAVGVFTGFTLAQAGLVRHWWVKRPRGWTWRAGLNGLGAVASGISTLVFVITKFTEGAWVVVITIPLLILLFVQVHAYYRRAAVELGLDRLPPRPIAAQGRAMAIVPVSDVSRATATALSVALRMADEVVAVSVVFADDSDRERRLQERWASWKPGVRLVLLHSEYHSVAQPMMRYVRSQKAAGKGRILVLLPVVIPAKVYEGVLHNHIDVALSSALSAEDGVIVVKVPLRLHEDEEDGDKGPAPPGPRGGGGEPRGEAP
ncbi:MAG TPA: APC family permease [Candidatus Dormibacteraeota bacterium]|nr:APC family permease [Candidatus Dormibacteraeota bacterium]